MRLVIILAATTAASALQAHAEEPVMLPPITLIANFEDTELSRTGSSVSVLEDDAFEDHAGQPLAKTIARLPGVSVRQTGPLGTTGQLQLRGAPAQYLPILIDGIDVSDAAAGQPYFDIGSTTSSAFSRAELLRGSQSALYGSRAVSGVLSLQSLRPEQDGLHHFVAAEAGSYESWQASYGLTFRNAATDLAFQASRTGTEGFSAKDEDDGNFEPDGFHGTWLSLYAAHELENGVIFGLSGFWDSSEGEFDDFNGDIEGTPGDDYTLRDSYGVRAFTKFSTANVDHDLSLTRYEIDRTSSSNGFDTPFVGARTKFSWQAAMDAGVSGHRVTVGVEKERETAKGDGRANLTSAYVGLFAPVSDQIDISASLRRDEHSRFGGYTSGRLAGVYRLQDDLLLRASFGNGFRAPSLYELFGPYGDATLDSEDSRSAEIGVEKQFGADSYVRATAFWLEADNLIGWDDRGTADYNDDGYNQIEGKARRKGIEFDGRYAFGQGYALTAAYTYTDNDAVSEWAEVAAHDLNLGLEAEFATGTLAALEITHLADRGMDEDDFTTVDLLVTHPIRDQAEVYMRVENILDEDYQYVDSYGTSDRAVYAGFRASF